MGQGNPIPPPSQDPSVNGDTPKTIRDNSVGPYAHKKRQPKREAKAREPKLSVEVLNKIKTELPPSQPKE